MRSRTPDPSQASPVRPGDFEPSRSRTTRRVVPESDADDSDAMDIDTAMPSSPPQPASHIHTHTPTTVGSEQPEEHTEFPMLSPRPTQQRATTGSNVSPASLANQVFSATNRRGYANRNSPVRVSFAGDSQPRDQYGNFYKQTADGFELPESVTRNPPATPSTEDEEDPGSATAEDTEMREDQREDEEEQQADDDDHHDDDDEDIEQQEAQQSGDPAPDYIWEPGESQMDEPSQQPYAAYDDHVPMQGATFDIECFLLLVDNWQGVNTHRNLQWFREYRINISDICGMDSAIWSRCHLTEHEKQCLRNAAFYYEQARSNIAVGTEHV